MDLWTIIMAIACGIAVVQSLFLSGYLFFKSQKVATPIFFLSIMLLSIAIRIAKSYFYYVFEDYKDEGIIIGAAGLWAIGPSFLLYTLSSKPTNISFKHYLHYLPTILILIICLGVGQLIGRLYFWGALSFLVYFLLSLYIYFYRDWNGNKKRFTLFATSTGIICGCFLGQVLISNVQVYFTGAVIALIVLYIINFLILKDQAYLRIPTFKTKKVAPAQTNKIVTALEKSFEQDKIYRQKGLTLATVSEATAFPTYQVSKTINQHFGMKFNAYVNQYRIEEAKKRLQDLETNDKIEVIAKEVGFSSTSSLYTAFKKETKVTPQAFRKQLKSAD